MRVSFAGFMLCEVKFNVPNDKAAAKLKDVEEKDEPGECFDAPVGTCEVPASFFDWRRNWRALASAFS